MLLQRRLLMLRGLPMLLLLRGLLLLMMPRGLQLLLLHCHCEGH